MDFMDHEWWTLFATSWNRSPERSRLAGLGAVGFELRDSKQEITWIEWDTNGHARVLDHRPQDGVVFRASEQNWNAFFQFRFRAVIGVLSKKLGYEGSMARIMPYAAAFDAVPVAVRSMNTSGAD